MFRTEMTVTVINGSLSDRHASGPGSGLSEPCFKFKWNFGSLPKPFTLDGAV